MASPFRPAATSTRRALLARGATAAGALALGSLGLSQAARALDAEPVSAASSRRQTQPNVLVILVDEMRAPRWFPDQASLDRMLPHTASIRRGAVSFARHFVASNCCTPARGALVTGLYSHQTGCLVTGRSELDPGFPTWGTLLREHGYTTTWWGKWHLSRSSTLEPWGFSGGTFPSPNGAPGQGLRADPLIAGQFESWLADAGGDGPWCTTVSFVNPHDIVWWYRYTRHHPRERHVPRVFTRLPGNFETPEQLRERGKPRLQSSLQDVAAAGFGEVPYRGREARALWCAQRDLYLQLQRDVDVQIGRVLRALAAQPQIARDTVIVFTSDHGEYGGSHGLRGKGGGVYDEGIQVPLFVKDPRGTLTARPEVPRPQLTSSVDIAPLLLTIAAGSSAWRRDPRYAHLASRADLAAMCADPRAPGRPWIVHATDEVQTEFSPQLYDAAAPRHVVSVRTAHAKYAVYSNWRAGSLEVAAAGAEHELYEYSSTAGRLELDNRHGASALEEPMARLLAERAVPDELRAPLPTALAGAQARGLRDYRQVSSVVQAQVTRDLHRHALIAERHIPSVPREPFPLRVPSPAVHPPHPPALAPRR